MTYKEALELNESAEGLSIEDLDNKTLLSLLDELPAWDYPLAEELLLELADRAGIDCDDYFTPKYIESDSYDRALVENPDYDPETPHGDGANDLWVDAARMLGVDV